jgi:transcriptional regulator with GAF, ATPase, and Fis domain
MTLSESMSWIRWALVTEAVMKSSGNRAEAARRLGVHDRTVRSILKKGNRMPVENLRAEYPRLSKLTAQLRET